jgi:hypothetical protein
MKIGKRWSVRLEEVSSGHYHCRAVDRDGRVLECEGDDDRELEIRIRVDAYLYDNMVLNKLLLRSLRGRNGVRGLTMFLGGYKALDDSDSGWRTFLDSLTALKEMRNDLTLEEFVAVEELHESLTSVFPLLLRGGANQEAEQ